MRVLLRGGTVVTQLDPAAVVAGDVLVDGDRVAAVGLARDLPAEARAASVIDCSGCVVIPGNVCAHTHAYSALARGMPFRLEAPRTFLEILRRVWWRLDRALDEDTIRASAEVAAAEALLAGTTTLVDHHASPNLIGGSLDMLAEAFGRLGVRSILAYEVTDRDGPDRAAAGLRENARFLARVAAGQLPLARGLVGAHASFTLSDDTLAGCVDLARSTGRGLHVHVAEDAVDEEDSRARQGVSVLERLHRAGAFEPRPLLAHGVHLDAAEASLVRASDATIVHNARSNMNNAVGRPPLELLGAHVALGTDGIGADMFEESRVAYLRFRDDAAADPSAARGGSSQGPHPGWPLARLAASSQVAADAFDEPQIGQIAPRAPADLVVLDPPLPTPLTAATLAGHWVFGMSARGVRDVLVGGHAVVRDRRLTEVDQDALFARARDAARRLWQRLEEVPEHAFDPREVAVG